MANKRQLQIWILFVMSWTVTPTRGECGPPPIIERSGNNATLDAWFSEGTVVQYFCDLTSYRQGWPLYECNNRSWTNWEDSDLQCIWKTCLPPRIDHGTYKADSLTVGTFAYFECDEGYKLTGSHSALCRIDRRWRGIPTCQIVKCQHPERIPFMRRFLNTHGQEPNLYGNHIHNECEDGFNLIGPSVQMCEGNGQWTHPSPYCIEIDCGAPTIGSGEAFYDSTNFMSNAWVWCDEDSVREGDEFIFCFEDGWTHSFCHGPCEVPSITGGEVGMSRLAYNESLIWSCEPGFVKGSHHDITCRGGNLTETPTCREVNFNNDSTCPGPLGPGYHVTRYHDTCYIFIDVFVEYKEARRRCWEKGWYPVSPENSNESEFVSIAVNQLWDSLTWLGIEFSDKHDAWIQSDGALVEYTNWQAGEGGKSFWFYKFEECAMLEKGDHPIRKWNDIECDEEARVMCQVASLKVTQ